MNRFMEDLVRTANNKRMISILAESRYECLYECKPRQANRCEELIVFQVVARNNPAIPKVANFLLEANATCGKST